jgi:hypothetical protein
MISSRAVILHASRAAVDCVAEYYAAHAPEIECTHLLDDGIMRMLRAEEWARPSAGSPQWPGWRTGIRSRAACSRFRHSEGA